MKANELDIPEDEYAHELVDVHKAPKAIEEPASVQSEESKEEMKEEEPEVESEGEPDESPGHKLDEDDESNLKMVQEFE